MKKRVLFIAFAIISMIGVASAQDTKTKSADQQNNRRVCFVDENQDGVCDNYANGTCRVGNGKGRMDGTGNGCNGQYGRAGRRGHGGRNGEMANGRRGGMRGCQGQGRRGGNGNCANFVDKDKNGVCDYFESQGAKEVKK